MFASTIIIIDSTIRNSLYNDVPVTALTGSMLGIIAFVEIGFILLSWRVFKEMGWQIYHGEAKDFGNECEELRADGLARTDQILART
jgi:hypothetical protein